MPIPVPKPRGRFLHYLLFLGVWLSKSLKLNSLPQPFTLTSYLRFKIH
jgi:hypothetical protein